MPKISYIKDRLDEALSADDLELVKEQFTYYLVAYNLDPQKLKVDADLVDGIIARMEKLYPEWEQLRQSRRLIKRRCSDT